MTTRTEPTPIYPTSNLVLNSHPSAAESNISLVPSHSIYKTAKDSTATTNNATTARNSEESAIFPPEVVPEVVMARSEALGSLMPTPREELIKSELSLKVGKKGDESDAENLSTNGSTAIPNDAEKSDFESVNSPTSPRNSSKSS